MHKLDERAAHLLHLREEILAEVEAVREEAASRARELLKFEAVEVPESLRTHLLPTLLQSPMDQVEFAGVQRETDRLQAELKRRPGETLGFGLWHCLHNNLTYLAKRMRDLRELEASDVASPVPPSVDECPGATGVSAGGRAERRGQRVLIVEDDVHWQAYLSRTVRHALPHVPVEAVGTYDDAMARLKAMGRAQRLVVVLDLGLPKNDSDSRVDTSWGLELLRVMSPRMRVVVVTTMRNMLDDHKQAVSLGVSPDDYIFKDSRDFGAELVRSLVRVTTPCRGFSSLVLVVNGPCASEVTVYVDSIEFHLCGQQARLLLALARQRGLPVDKQQLATDAELDPSATLKLLAPLRRAFCAAFKKVGRYLDPTQVILSTKQGPRTVYSFPTRDVRMVEPKEGEVIERPTEEGPLRVLVVEDDSWWRRQISEALRTAGFCVAEAASREQALVEAEHFRPQLVMLDLQIPPRSGEPVEKDGGFQAFQGIRAVLTDQEVRAVVLSDVASEDRLRDQGVKGLGIPVHDWIDKRSDGWSSLLLRSALRVEWEVRNGIVLPPDGRTSYVVEILRDDHFKLNGQLVILGEKQGRFLTMLAEHPYAPVGDETLVGDIYPETQVAEVDDNLAWDMTKLRSLKNDVGKHAQAAGLDPDRFIQRVDGGYQLCARVLPTRGRNGMKFIVLEDNSGFRKSICEKLGERHVLVVPELSQPGPLDTEAVALAVEEQVRGEASVGAVVDLSLSIRGSNEGLAIVRRLQAAGLRLDPLLFITTSLEIRPDDRAPFEALGGRLLSKAREDFLSELMSAAEAMA